MKMILIYIHEQKNTNVYVFNVKSLRSRNTQKVLRLEDKNIVSASFVLLLRLISTTQQQSTARKKF